MPEISVILPVYNGEKTIRETIDSLLKQSFSNFELIICIDGTNDQSEDIVRSFNDTRIHLIKNESNLGLGRTLNRLISFSNDHSKYIAMAEQDDYYYPDRLMLQYEFMENNPDCGLVSGIAEHFDGEKVTFSFPGLLVSGNNYPENPIDNFLLNYCYQVKVVNSCMMFRKSVHIENGLYFSMHYSSISVDWSYILRFSLVGIIRGLNTPLVRLDRRRNRTSLTTQTKIRFAATREVIRSFYFEHKSLISKKNYRTALTSAFLIELAHMPYVKKLIYFPFFFLKDIKDPRWKFFFKKHILRQRNR